jgi:hypothetical protein
VSLLTAPPNSEPAHPARIGAGEVGTGNQRVGDQRAALIGPQRLAPPLHVSRFV